MSDFSKDTFEENYIDRLQRIKEVRNSMSDYVKSEDCPLPKEEIEKIKSVLKMYDDFVWSGERFINKLNS